MQDDDYPSSTDDEEYANRFACAWKNFASQDCDTDTSTSSKKTRGKSKSVQPRSSYILDQCEDDMEDYDSDINEGNEYEIDSIAENVQSNDASFYRMVDSCTVDHPPDKPTTQAEACNSFNVLNKKELGNASKRLIREI